MTSEEDAGRTACVVSKTCAGDIRRLHLETEDGVADVVVPLDIWHRFDLGAYVTVPDGDLSNPQVAARIRWVF